MELKRINERVWVSSFEEERDRPAIGYIRGDKLCLAVDAGHSREHVEEFYALLGKNGLPLPELTVLTHWHWLRRYLPTEHRRRITSRRRERRVREPNICCFKTRHLDGYGDDSLHPVVR